MPVDHKLSLDNYPIWEARTKLLLLSHEVAGGLVISFLEGQSVASPVDFDPEAYFVKYYGSAIKLYGITLSGSMSKLQVQKRRQSLLPLVSEEDGETFQDADASATESIFTQMNAKNKKLSSDMLVAFIAYQNSTSKDLLHIFAVAVNEWFSDAMLTAFEARSTWLAILASRDIYELLKLAKEVCTERGGDRVAGLKIQVNNVKQQPQQSISALKVEFDKIYNELALYGHVVPEIDKSWNMSRAITNKCHLQDLITFNQSEGTVPLYERFCRTLLNTENAYALVTLQLGMTDPSLSESSRLLLAPTGGERLYCTICFDRTKARDGVGIKFPHLVANCHHK
jgi:hypothetical protein